MDSMCKACGQKIVGPAIVFGSGQSLPHEPITILAPDNIDMAAAGRQFAEWLYDNVAGGWADAFMEEYTKRRGQ